jgi:WD40 repeat protein
LPKIVDFQSKRPQMTLLLDSDTEEADASEAAVILKRQGATLSRLDAPKFDSAVVALAALPDGQLSHRLSNGSIWISGPELSTREIARGVSRGYGALASLRYGCLGFSDGAAVQIWDPTRGKIARIEVCSEEVLALAALQDSRIASGSCDNLIRLWEPGDGALTRELHGHKGWINALATLEDGSLVSGSSDNTVRIWDPESGYELTRFECPGNGVTSLAVLRDGRIAVGSWDPIIRLWDPTTGAVAAELVGHRFSIYALAVLPDGRLASGSSDKTIRLWDPRTGTETARPERHLGVVNALAVLPNGRLVSGSDDRTIRFWDAVLPEKAVLYASCLSGNSSFFSGLTS